MAGAHCVLSLSLVFAVGGENSQMIQPFEEDPAIACLCLRDTCFQASSDWQMKIIRNMGLQDEIVVQHGREGERRLLAGQA